MALAFLFEGLLGFFVCVFRMAKYDKFVHFVCELCISLLFNMHIHICSHFRWLQSFLLITLKFALKC